MSTPYLRQHVVALLGTTQRLLHPSTWVKGKPTQPQCHCLVTGLYEAMQREGCGRDVFNHAERLLYDALGAPAKGGRMPMRLALVDFNDHPDTTHADVMALLDDAMRAA